jgi:hypothetical protein
MMRGGYLKFAVLLFVLLTLPSAVGNPTIFSEKFSLDTAVEGNSILVPIRVFDVNDLYSVSLNISYDNPSLVSLKNVLPGPFLGSSNEAAAIGLYGYYTNATAGAIQI